MSLNMLRSLQYTEDYYQNADHTYIRVMHFQLPDGKYLIKAFELQNNNSCGYLEYSFSDNEIRLETITTTKKNENISGIGTLLMYLLMQAAQKNNIAQVRTTMVAPDAIEFYQKMGFVGDPNLEDITIRYQNENEEIITVMTKPELITHIDTSLKITANKKIWNKEEDFASKKYKDNLIKYLTSQIKNISGYVDLKNFFIDIYESGLLNCKNNLNHRSSIYKPSSSLFTLLIKFQKKAIEVLKTQLANTVELDLDKIQTIRKDYSAFFNIEIAKRPIFSSTSAAVEFKKLIERYEDNFTTRKLAK